jgi:hypothetical protein
MAKQQIEIIDFVKQTTVAITTISEATKSLEQTTGAIKELITTQTSTNNTQFEKLGGKMDGLSTMFKYVIVPLIGGILALVGIKTIFKL